MRWRAVRDGRLLARIAADRVLRDPLDDHAPETWPPDAILAPLADLAVEPARDTLPPWAHAWPTDLYAAGPADGHPGERVLARGTRLRPIAHGADPYHEGLDLDGYEILDGPDAGAHLAVGCGGRWASGANVAAALLARADEPIFGDPDAGARLLADLRTIAASGPRPPPVGCRPGTRSSACPAGRPGGLQSSDRPR